MKIERILGGFASLGLVAALAVPVALAKSQATPPPQAVSLRMRRPRARRCPVILR